MTSTYTATNSLARPLIIVKLIGVSGYLKYIYDSANICRLKKNMVVLWYGVVWYGASWALKVSKLGAIAMAFGK